MTKSLPNGLLVRRATAADTDTLATFTADVSRYQDANRPDESIAIWTRDLMTRRHPTFAPEDFTVVEDTRNGVIVSSANLISQTWAYGGLDVAVGQVELVGTHPDYRGRGLIREQMHLLHQWSATRGQQLLAIDGIPWFYRQFGYEMALALRDEISVAASCLPPLPDGAIEPFRIRAAEEPDLAFVRRTYDQAATRYLVGCRRDDAVWRYELGGRSAGNPWRMAIRIVERGDGRRVGFLTHHPHLVGSTVMLAQYEIASDVAWDEVTPSVLRYLAATGITYARAADRRFTRIACCLGGGHPVYPLLGAYEPRDEGAYAWYLRVADLPAFLRHVAPLLELRLKQSEHAHYTGELLLTFYRDGLRLVFQHGRFTGVTPWRQPFTLSGVEKGVPGHAERAGAAFPDLTFLQLLFGYRSFAELQHAFPDCLSRTDETRALLATLFPKHPSNVWPVL